MAESLGFGMDGLNELDATLDALARQAAPAVARAVLDIGETIMAEAKTLVPVETGALRASGHVEPPEIEGQEVSLTLGFGGPAVPYALVQHERTDFRHRVGQAKYLEIPLMKYAPQAAERMRHEIDDLVRRRAGR